MDQGDFARALPEEFQAALTSASTAVLRAELRVSETAAPEGLAPFQAAWAADVEPGAATQDLEYGTGRLVFLYDPAVPEQWGSAFRMVVFAQAPVDATMGADQFLPDVAWSWLMDALEARGADHNHAAGTTTTVLSTGFGELAEQGQGAQVEVRASWSPLSADIKPHMEAWSEFVCMLAGFPPTPDGVTSISPQRSAS